MGTPVTQHMQQQEAGLTASPNAGCSDVPPLHVKPSIVQELWQDMMSNLALKKDNLSGLSNTNNSLGGKFINLPFVYF